MSEHEHQYTIAVEWEYIKDTAPYTTDMLVYGPQVIQSKRVSKLRCVCGEEIER